MSHRFMSQYRKQAGQRVGMESFEGRWLLFSITDAAFGASVGNPDNTTQIQAAINAAFASATDKVVLVPAGQFKHSGVITVKAGVELKSLNDFGGTGARAELRHTATNGRNASINLIGSGPKLRNLWITSAYDQTQPNARLQQDDTVLVRADGASNYFIERNEIQGGASVGIKNTNGSNNGAINSNKVHNTLADGIHTTHGSHHLTISNDTVSATNDDMIAVVSYDPTQSSFGPCTNINIHTNNCNNSAGKNGRGITVVGGNTVTINNNTIANAPHAGIYIASENTSAYHTLGVDGVTITKNIITNANRLNLGSHGGIFLKGRDATLNVKNVTIGNMTDDALGNTITGSTGQSINIEANTDTIKILRNTLDTSSKDGIKVLSSKNVQINNNIIRKTQEHGIHFQSGTSGTITVNSNQFVDINRSNLANRHVVYFATGNSFGSISATNNTYSETVNYTVNFFVYYVGYTAIATVSGNNAGTTGAVDKGV
jgi:hypothetical protein